MKLVLGMKLDRKQAPRAFAPLPSNADSRTESLFQMALCIPRVRIPPGNFGPFARTIPRRAPPFDVADAQSLFHDLSRDRHLRVGSVERQERAGMTGRELLLGDEAPDLPRESEETHQVRYGGAVLPYPQRHLLLRVAELGDEPSIRPRFLHGVELFPLDVLHESDLEQLAVGGLTDDDRYFLEARLARRAPPPLAGDDLKPRSPAPHAQRLGAPPPVH